jgi:hypothetical protein
MPFEYFEKLKITIKYKLNYILLLMLFIAYTTVINLQFIEGSNIHHQFQAHDEYLIVRDVYSILEPMSIKHFLLSIVSGNLLYYGRIMFYLDAAVAYLPYKIFGISGLIFAVRMFHSVVIFWSLCILGKTFIDKERNILLFLVSTLTIYYTTYFSMVPKPEPLQLLFLSYFLKYFKENKYKLGKYFVLLGIAYGIKFNVFPLILFFIIVGVYSNGFNIKKFLESIVAILVGLIAAMPCLILVPIKPIFLKLYIEQTFKNVKHFDDISSTNWMDWIKSVISEYYVGNLAIFLIMMAALLILYVSSIVRFLKHKKISEDLLVLLMGLFFSLPTILFIKRLWPHYLWTGFIFLVLYVYTTRSQFKIENIFQLIVKTLIIVGTIISFNKFGNDILVRSKSNDVHEAVMNTDKGLNYIFKDNINKVVCTDLSANYKFSYFIETPKYHPFSSPYPEPLSKRQVFIETPVDVNLLKTRRPNYLLLYWSDFNRNITKPNTDHDRSVINGYLEMRKLLGKVIFYDTMFGNYKLYRINLSALDSID